MSDAYPVIYQINYHEPPLPRDQVPPDCGAADEILIGSIIHTADGGRSYAFIGMDEKGGPMTAETMFKTWSIMASNLADDLPPGGQRDLCKLVFETVRAAVLATRASQSSEG